MKELSFLRNAESDVIFEVNKPRTFLVLFSRAKEICHCQWNMPSSSMISNLYKKWLKLVTMMNCFCGMVDHQKAFTLFSATVRDSHHQEPPTHHMQDLSLCWTFVVVRFCWMKLCSSDNHYTTTSIAKREKVLWQAFRIFQYSSRIIYSPFPLIILTDFLLNPVSCTQQMAPVPVSLQSLLTYLWESALVSQYFLSFHKFKCGKILWPDALHDTNPVLWRGPVFSLRHHLYNLGQNICNKVSKSGKTGQEHKTLITALA